MVGDWVALVVVGACFVTFLAVTLGFDLAFAQIDSAIERGWVKYGLTYVTVFCMLASWLPPARLSRVVRVAVLLPAAHAVVLVTAWLAWSDVSRFSDHDTVSALVTQFPMATIVIATLCVFVAFALLVARRREWLHGFLMLALAELLLLGLWLPISSSLFAGGEAAEWPRCGPSLLELQRRVIVSVVPPTLLAFGFAAFALRRPRQMLAYRWWTTAFVLGALTLGVAARLGALGAEMIMYANLLPILLAAMIVAIAALLVFGVGYAWTSYGARRELQRRTRAEGVIVDDDREPVAGVEITSWLRGPRVVQRRFAVSIAGATVPVSGAYLVASLPAATTQLATGECFAVLRPGDRVTIAGHAEAAGAPFRTSAAPLSGEIFVAPAERSPGWFPQVALAMWRPCVAYLLIVVAAALPALAALAAT